MFSSFVIIEPVHRKCNFNCMWQSVFYTISLLHDFTAATGKVRGNKLKLLWASYIDSRIIHFVNTLTAYSLCEYTFSVTCGHIMTWPQVVQRVHATAPSPSHANKLSRLSMRIGLALLTQWHSLQHSVFLLCLWSLSVRVNCLRLDSLEAYCRIHMCLADAQLAAPQMRVKEVHQLFKSMTANKNVLCTPQDYCDQSRCRFFLCYFSCDKYTETSI